MPTSPPTTGSSCLRRPQPLRPPPWRLPQPPAGDVAYPPSSAITDFLAVPGTHGAPDPAAAGWLGLLPGPTGTSNNGFYVGTGRAGRFHPDHAAGDIGPAHRRTTFSGSHGWLYAVVEDTATDDLIDQGVSCRSPAARWGRGTGSRHGLARRVGLRPG